MKYFIRCLIFRSEIENMSTEQVVFNEGIIRAVNTKNFFIYFPMEGKHEVTSGRLTKVTIPRLPKQVFTHL